MKFNFRVKSLQVDKSNCQNLDKLISKLPEKNISFPNSNQIKISFENNLKIKLDDLGIMFSGINSLKFCQNKRNEKNLSIEVKELFLSQQNSLVSLEILEIIFMCLGIQVNLIEGEESLLIVNLKDYLFEDRDKKIGFENILSKSLTGIYKLI